MNRTLDEKWNRERRVALSAALDAIVDELTDDPLFQDRLNRLLDLTGIEEWPTVVGLIPPITVYRVTRAQMVRLLMCTAVAARVPK